MKVLKNLSLLVVLALLFNCTEGKDTTVCNVENPLTDLLWLKTLVNKVEENFQEGDRSSVMSI